MAVHYDWNWDKHEHIRKSSRSLGLPQSDYFVMDPWTPAIRNLRGPVSYYDAKRIARVRKRLLGIDKKQYLGGIVERVLKPSMSPKEQVAALCQFVSNAIYYNPIQQPAEGPGENDLLMDPVELLELHDGRCGQGVAITVALLDAAGIECRKRDVFHHVTSEARYGGRWHLADALMFGANQPERDGKVLNVADLQREPYFADAYPLTCFVYTPEELMTRDGYRNLGYCFGDWGTLAYYSWYMGGEEEYPPTLPVMLFPERLAAGKVRLRWAPSGKRNGGAIRYRVRVYTDRERTQCCFETMTDKTSVSWKVPDENTMYYVGVAATDDHVKKNRNTWYPEAVINFVLVPPDQYGWYGIL